MNLKQLKLIRSMVRVQVITWTAITFGILWFLGLMVTAPLGVSNDPNMFIEEAQAAYTDTAEAPHGLVDVVPHFAGLEAGFSSESIHFVNEYGDCGWEVNECWLTDFIGAIPGVGIWQPAVVRGNPVVDLIPVHQGRSAVIFDWASADFIELGVLANTMGYLYTIDGNMEVYGADAAFQFRVNEQSTTPSTVATDFVYVQHDGVDGEVGTSAGDLYLDPVADVVTFDDVGINTAGPTEALHVIGSPRFEDGNEGVGTIWADNGTGTGVGAWSSIGSVTGGTWFLYDTASGDIAGYDTLFPDPSVGVIQTYTVLVPASPTLIEEFATEVGAPGITFINDGIAEFHFHARRSAGTMDIRVYAEIYTRTPVPVETLIATTELSNILTNVNAGYTVHAVVPFTVMDVADRLVVKVYANQIPPGANPTVQFYVEGVTATRLSLPGAEAGSALSHTVAAVPYNDADPTPVTLEVGVSESGPDFFVNVTCADLSGDRTWPAFGSPIPVAGFVTYYWAIEGGDLVAWVVNDSQRDINAIIWWTR